MSEVIRKGPTKNKKPLSVMVDDEYKTKYDKLSNEKKVAMSEHLRKVMYPEIDRVWELEFG